MRGVIARGSVLQLRIYSFAFNPWRFCLASPFVCPTLTPAPGAIPARASLPGLPKEEWAVPPWMEGGMRLLGGMEKCPARGDVS
ncbi:hypothetical protein Nmel_014187 [Mimus melanotis]